MSTTLIDADTLNTVLPMLDKLKAEILSYYEDKIQAGYLMEATKKLVDQAEKIWGDTEPLYLTQGDEAIFPLNTGLDALAATWIGVYLYSKKQFDRALKYFKTVQTYYKNNPERSEKTDLQFLDIAVSVCYAELGNYQTAAQYLAKVTPAFDDSK